jgi:hypothetical protein
MYELSDQEFLDSYWEYRDFIWWLFETKNISNKEREESLAPYRNRLHDMIKKGIIDEHFRLVKRP